MNKIILDSMAIRNFKGIASADFGFDEKITTIKGENGSGKTTIKNAFEWLLCQNVADVLPMLNNKEIPNLTTSVIATFNINGYDYCFERESKGKYVLNKETGKMNKTTNENTYKIDGMEYKEKDYKDKIANLFTNGVFENLQILTDKEYFNTDTTKFKWTDRRKILFEMCGVRNAVNSIIEKPEYACIQEYIIKGHATSDIKSMLKKNKSGYKDQQNKNNILIEQKITENTEIAKIDFSQVEQDLKEQKEKLAKMLTSTELENQSEQFKELQNQLVELTRQRSLLESEDVKKQNDLRKIMQELYNECQNIKFQYGVEKDKYNELSTKIKPLSNEECPTCHQKLPQEEINKLNEQINKENTETNKQLTKLEQEIKELRNKYNEKQQKFNDAKANLDNFTLNPEICKVNQSIVATMKAIEQAKGSDLNKLSTEQKTAIETQISALERTMAKKTYFEENQQLIQKWKNENKNIADLIVGIEQKENALEKYVKEQTDIIIDTVNSKFSNGVSWALYKETYKNGEGGIEEDCVCMYRGKRYSSLSTGEKNTTNIEIVKTLQDYYGTNICIFSDNAEANTISFDSADRQIIELYATKGETLDGVIKITDLYKGEN
jgi:DNA repair exonuclease SbcCD ATPase subunit